MGTIGGSVSHADPAADYPASLLALGAKVRLVRAGGERTLSLDDFLVDTFTTAAEPGEIVREIIVPVEESKTGVNYQKMLHRPLALPSWCRRRAAQNQWQDQLPVWA
jgi:carbon-monoxide dehydrogenase medium subunit